MVLRSTVIALVALLSLFVPASASTFNVLKTFCVSTNCRDGNTPTAPIFLDPSGNLFGVTYGGGAHGKGTVFELRKAATGYTFHRIYDFCSQTNCTDGDHPYSGLIMDTAGNLYGTASNGGANGTGFRGGIVFKLTPGAKPSQQWTLTKLHDFCAKANCVDGKTPMAGLTYQGASSGLYDGVSPLFGTTIGGGTAAQGVAYKLTYVPGRIKRVEKAFYSFCSVANCADGLQPGAPLTIDGAGNIYGTTNYGGANGSSTDGGVAFQFTPKHRGYRYTVLHSFCALAECADGDMPSRGGLTIDGSGNLLGTAYRPEGGIIYKLTPAGTGSTISTLYTFCADTICDDGAAPDWPLLIDSNGDIVGATNGGGTATQPAGTVYRLHDGTLTVLHSFCLNCDDGAYPRGIAMDTTGNIFGVTFMTRNTGAGGTVFALTP
ncbi:MAG TPA: choice-of-anchor tandem repeat GloVer-containing protein [Rhizomicrobium sp.]|nr:choice-of-anchor tandem repeat GloVer-containing protein [Rhizomicrobium sp.]